jgi:hypothetical protein
MSSGFGGSWFGGSWFGGSWVDPSAVASGGTPVFAMRADQPLAAKKSSNGHPPLNLNAKFGAHEWDADLLALMVLPEFMAMKIGGKTWEDAIVLPPPDTVTEAALADLSDA